MSRTLPHSRLAAPLVVAAIVLSATIAHAATPATSKTSTSRPAAAKPAATPSTRHPAARAAAPRAKAVLAVPGDVAREARALEDLGAYGQCVDQLQILRSIAGPDADLDLALAVNLARTGEPDSAAVLLWNPLLSAAIHDTLPESRHAFYAWKREPIWLNRQFDGWHWYVARARAEVALSLRRWDQAVEAARICADAKPQSGSEWYLLAFAAAHAGDQELAFDAVRKSLVLDPITPEALYLLGVLEWRAGRRSAAADCFRRAIPIDSLYREPAIAALKARLPGAPDSLPGRLLTGARATTMLTSPDGPKPEEFVQMESPAQMIRGARADLPDSLKSGWNSVRISPVVLIDERGLIVAHHMPWMRPHNLPDALVGLVVKSLPEWRFRPGFRLGKPARSWATIDMDYISETRH
jgi:tetratricopeptide (TPR) repeat protein